MFLEGVTHLLLVVHDLLLLVLDEHPPVHAQDEGRSVVLPVIVELRVDELGWHRFTLILGTEEQLDVVLD